MAIFLRQNIYQSYLFFCLDGGVIGDKERRVRGSELDGIDLHGGGVVWCGAGFQCFFNEIHIDLPFTFGFQLTPILTFEVILDQVAGVSGNIHPTHLPGTFDTRRDIHCVTPDIKRKFPLTHDTRYDWPRMNANP